MSNAINIKSIWKVSKEKISNTIYMLMETLQKEINELLNEITELKTKPIRIESLKKAQSKYYEKNKQKINKYKGQYNKEYGKREFECKCGQKMPFHSKAKHMKTKKHLRQLEDLHIDRGFNSFLTSEFIIKYLDKNLSHPAQIEFKDDSEKYILDVIINDNILLKISTLTFDAEKIKKMLHCILTLDK